MKNPSTTRLASALIVGQNPINDEGMYNENLGTFYDIEIIVTIIFC